MTCKKFSENKMETILIYGIVHPTIKNKLYKICKSKMYIQKKIIGTNTKIRYGSGVVIMKKIQQE
jgi:hypothetical protein